MSEELITDIAVLKTEMKYIKSELSDIKKEQGNHKDILQSIHTDIALFKKDATTEAVRKGRIAGVISGVSVGAILMTIKHWLGVGSS